MTAVGNDAVIRCFTRNELAPSARVRSPVIAFLFSKNRARCPASQTARYPGQRELDVAVSTYCSDCPASAFSGVFVAASVSVCFIIAQQSPIILGMDAIFS